MNMNRKACGAAIWLVLVCLATGCQQKAASVDSRASLQPAPAPASDANPPIEPVRSDPSMRAEQRTDQQQQSAATDEPNPGANDGAADSSGPDSGRSYSPPAEPPAEHAPAHGARVHIVKRGETFSSIAKKYYGSTKQWRKIYAANRNRVKDPKRIPAGIKLIIP